MPLEVPMVAIDVMLLLQVPPVVISAKVVDDAPQILNVPVMEATACLTVTLVV